MSYFKSPETILAIKIARTKVNEDGRIENRSSLNPVKRKKYWGSSDRMAKIDKAREERWAMGMTLKPRTSKLSSIHCASIAARNKKMKGKITLPKINLPL